MLLALNMQRLFVVGVNLTITALNVVIVDF